jgi:hypothetical protein
MGAEGGTVAKDLLLLGANAPDMDVLRARIAKLGYRVIAAKTPDQAHGLLRMGGPQIGAGIVPSDLPVSDLRAALEALRRLVPGHDLAWLGAGADPGAEGRRRLRDAGVRIPIFDPVDAHSLRFQLNRALAAARPRRVERRTLRAPADWPVVVRHAGRAKEGRIYSISASGAYVALERPSVLRTQVTLDILLPGSRRGSATGRVAATNVPGNLRRTSLPVGMGIQFDQLSEAASVDLLVYAQERVKALTL